MLRLPADVYPHGLRLGDLHALAQSPRNSGEEAVQAYYGWREARAMTVAKGTAAAAASLLTAWLVPYLKTELRHVNVWLACGVPVVLVLGLASFAFATVHRMNRIHLSFVRAVGWLHRL